MKKTTLYSVIANFFLLIIVFLFNPLTAFSQQVNQRLDICATPANNSPSLNYLPNQLNQTNINNFSQKTFNINYLQIVKDDGTSWPYTSMEEVKRAHEDLNDAFSEFNICFNLKSYDTIRNTMYEHTSPYSIDNLISLAQNIGKYDDNAINVFLYKFTFASGIKRKKGIAVSKWNFRNDLYSKTFVHEIGHFLGLYHIHDTWEYSNCEHVTRDPNDPNYNANSHGDKITDTYPTPDFVWEQREYGVKALQLIGYSPPAARAILTNENGFINHPDAIAIEQALLDYGFTTGEISYIKTSGIKHYAYIDPETCSYIGAVRPNSDMFKDCEGTPYIITENEVRNFMTNSLADCMDSFTAEQGLRMQNSIEGNNPDLNNYTYIQNALAEFPTDLYSQNTIDDIGAEPDIHSGEVLWRSPDIWVRNQNDGLINQEHENPIYQENTPVFVYVRIHNKGCQNFNGNASLMLHWAKANTGGWSAYNGEITNPVVMGGPVSEQNITNINAGESGVFSFEWYPPNPDDYEGIGDNNPWHFCLLTRILSEEDPMASPAGQGNMVYKNNNVVAKNVTIDKVSVEPTLTPGGKIAIGNLLSQKKTRSFTLEFKNLDNATEGEIWKEAEVIVNLDNDTWNKWDQGGRQSENIRLINEAQKKLYITDNNAKLKNLTYAPHEWSTLSINFYFLTRKVSRDNYAYHILQRDMENNSVIGTESFLVQREARKLFMAVAEKNNTTLTATDIGEPAIYNWYDLDGNLLSTGSELIVNSTSPEYKLEVIAQSDKYKDYDTVTVENVFGIKTISPNPASNQIDITYLLPHTVNAYLSIVPLSGNYNNLYEIQNSEQSTIAINNYLPGLYVISLIVNNEIIDSKNLLIEQ